MPQQDPGSMWNGFGQAWTYVSYLVAGILIWSGIGYGLDRLIGTWPVLFVVGVFVGNAGGIYLIYLRTMPKNEDSNPQHDAAGPS